MLPSLGAYFGFGNRMILENFHRSGKYDSLSTALNIWVSSTIACLGRHLATSAVIKSKPGDFLRQYFWMVNLISLGEKYLTGGVFRKGKSRYLSTAFVLVGETSWLGWKTLKRWFLNSSAFWESNEA